MKLMAHYSFIIFIIIIIIYRVFLYLIVELMLFVQKLEGLIEKLLFHKLTSKNCISERKKKKRKKERRKEERKEKKRKD